VCVRVCVCVCEREQTDVGLKFVAARENSTRFTEVCV